MQVIVMKLIVMVMVMVMTVIAMQLENADVFGKPFEAFETVLE